ncbi:MAG: LysR family transcriptional regulator [SAR86 cluster bacterium]|uniref:LysR family transcriptional regulator n=1 Tax=SAR86 cluster bacterium TaxID=2030880 RepID=A0A2A5C660_9GAMM|nr:LysR family transcriptional regulator [Gammaproteobacteria bacterium AH-315-E17]PCJ39379.1 MAG: LysR family transcriptional regulator [SAR86 cluster bacterium]
MRIKGLDLNLLLAFDILLEERSVSRTAKRLHLSQPAISAALGRLRNFFKDDLLVLHGKQLIPTSYAESLVPEVKRILAQVDGLIAMSSDFDPVRSERLFRLMASDYMLNVLITPVIASIQHTAPNVKLNIRLSEESVRTEFERGRIDLMIVPDEFLSVQHPSELLFEERHVVVGWNKNALMTQKMSTKVFLKSGHINVEMGANGYPPFTERHMEKLGYQRRIEVYAPHFSVVPWMILETKRLAVMPERLALKFCKVFPLKMAPLPFEFPLMRVMAQFHSARAGDQGLKWLRDCLHETVRNSVP